MADRDFSYRTVAQKLGINPGDEITILNAPENYLNLISNIDISVTHTLKPNLQFISEGEKVPFIHYFVKSKNKLEKDFPNLKKHLAKNGSLWVSNLKNQKDFNQNDVQSIGLGNGLVDVKVASLNDQWSAMKFVYRRVDR